MKLKIIKNTPLKLDQLNEYEKEFNLVIPKEYKDFLLESNGGEISKFSYIKSKHIKKKIWLHELWKIDHIFDCLRSSIEVYKERPDADHLDMELFKRGHLLIGMTSAEEFISICFKGDREGTVFNVWYDGDIELEEIRYSFDDFINGFEYEE